MDKVYTKIIPDASGTTLIPIIETKVIPDSIVYSDCWTGYNVLDVSDFKHYHINGIESFWNQAKRHMRKFNGVPKDNFGLFLEECEWHFNTPSPKCQLTQLKQWANQLLN